MPALKTRIATAFAALRAKGYFAEGPNMCCTTCGNYQVVEREKERGKEFPGYVFYHDQNVDDIRERKECYLAFGAPDDDVSEINKMIALMKVNGLVVEWDGNMSKKILVK